MDLIYRFFSLLSDLPELSTPLLFFSYLILVVSLAATGKHTFIIYI